MSWWVMPTTADIGFRAFSDSPIGILRESALALQGIQLSDRGIEYLDGHIRHVAEWSIPFGSSDIERTLVRWLEEVLFNSYVEDKWLVESEFSLDEDYLRAQVLWVDSRDVELEIEVKAVTLHDLVVRQVAMCEVVDGVEGLPSFERPALIAKEVLDI